MTSSLQSLLESGRFVATAEVCPPKGSDCTGFLARAAALKGSVDAVNVTDNQGANMRISPLAASALLLRAGIEPILQLTCRDRNRLALQSELLGAAALGVTNVLALTGDHISCGDHPEGKPVFDIDSVQLLEIVSRLNSGTDAAGRTLEGKPFFFAGAAAAPAAEPFDLAMFKVEKKIAAGARFLQTQAIFDPDKLIRLTEAVRPSGIKVIAGVFLLKSAGMARFVNRNIPGLTVPDHMEEELDRATDPLAAGVEAARRLVKECRDICDGVHIMALGREDLIPAILA
jgi:methylenetetrahydrofolate reductase (NADPH)